MVPEDSVIWLRITRPSHGVGRFIIVFTETLMEPEDSLPCLQSFLWNQKIHLYIYIYMYVCNRTIEMHFLILILFLVNSSACFEKASCSSSGGILTVCAIFGIDHAENISDCLSLMLSKL